MYVFAFLPFRVTGAITAALPGLVAAALPGLVTSIVDGCEKRRVLTVATMFGFAPNHRLWDNWTTEPFHNYPKQPYWLVIERGSSEAAPRWPMNNVYLHTLPSVLDVMDTMVAVVLVINRYPSLRPLVVGGGNPPPPSSAIADEAAAAVQERWIAFSKPTAVAAAALGTATVSEVAAVLEWPEWIRERSELLRRQTHAVFFPGELDAQPPLNEDFVASLRVVAIFYDIVGVAAVDGTMRRAASSAASDENTEMDVDV